MAVTTTTSTDPLAGKQTATESSLSSWVGPYVTEMLGRGQALSETPYTPYTGPLTAGASNLQQEAFSGIAGLALPTGVSEAATNAGNLATGMAGMNYGPTTFTSGTWDTNVMNQYMNPFVEGALRPQIAEVQRQAEIDRIANAGRMTRAGSYGGSRQAILEAELDRNLMSKVADITGQGYSTAYDKAFQAWLADQDRNLRTQQATEQSKQFGAGFDLEALRSALDATRAQGDLAGQEFTMDRQRLQDMLQAGGVERGIESEGIAAMIKQFEQERDDPFKKVQFMQSLLQGLPLATESYSYMEPTGISALLGGAGGILGLLQSLRDLNSPAPATGGNP